MAEIQPFRAVHYAPSFAKDLGSLICPPYDIISPEEQEAFYQAHPANVIRLVLGKQFPDDTQTNNRYTRAGAALNRWLADRTLVRDEQPSFTIYQMEFDGPDGGRRTLDGVLCLVRVEEYGKGRVLPHEKTYKGPKQDQLNLMRACRANLTPIHALYGSDRETTLNQFARFTRNPPEWEASDAHGSVHRIWTVQDAEWIATLQDELRDKSLFIADGHHRYETAMAFRDEIRAAGSTDPNAPHEFVMMYLTSMAHPGLTILSAHRLIKGLKDLKISTLLQVLEPYFDIEELPFDTICPSPACQGLIDKVASYASLGGSFGMVVQGEMCFRLLKLKDFARVNSLMDVGIPGPLRSLDVTILREVIMNHGLGMDGENAEGQIEYTPVVHEALNKVVTGEVQIGFILNPTRVEQMREAAELGHKLPHKSTYFYPKLSSGLAVYVY